MDFLDPRVGCSAFLRAAAVSISRPAAIRSKPAGSSARSECPNILWISSCEKCADSLSIKPFNLESLCLFFCRPLRFVAIAKSSVITIGRQHGMPRGRRVLRHSSGHPGKVTVSASLAGQNDQVSEGRALPVRLDPRVRSMISTRPSDALTSDISKSSLVRLHPPPPRTRARAASLRAAEESSRSCGSS